MPSSLSAGELAQGSGKQVGLGADDPDPTSKEKPSSSSLPQITSSSDTSNQLRPRIVSNASYAGSSLNSNYSAGPFSPTLNPSQNKHKLVVCKSDVEFGKWQEATIEQFPGSAALSQFPASGVSYPGSGAFQTSGDPTRLDMVMLGFGSRESTGSGGQQENINQVTNQNTIQNQTAPSATTSGNSLATNSAQTNTSSNPTNNIPTTTSGTSSATNLTGPTNSSLTDPRPQTTQQIRTINTLLGDTNAANINPNSIDLPYVAPQFLPPPAEKILLQQLNANDVLSANPETQTIDVWRTAVENRDDIGVYEEMVGGGGNTVGGLVISPSGLPLAGGLGVGNVPGASSSPGDSGYNTSEDESGSGSDSEDEENSGSDDGNLIPSTEKGKLMVQELGEKVGSAEKDIRNLQKKVKERERKYKDIDGDSDSSGSSRSRSDGSDDSTDSRSRSDRSDSLNRSGSLRSRSERAENQYNDDTGGVFDDLDERRFDINTAETAGGWGQRAVVGSDEWYSHEALRNKRDLQRHGTIGLRRRDKKERSNTNLKDRSESYADVRNYGRRGEGRGQEKEREKERKKKKKDRRRKDADQDDRKASSKEGSSTLATVADELRGEFSSRLGKESYKESDNPEVRKMTSSKSKVGRKTSGAWEDRVWSKDSPGDRGCFVEERKPFADHDEKPDAEKSTNPTATDKRLALRRKSSSSASSGSIGPTDRQWFQAPEKVGFRKELKRRYSEEHIEEVDLVAKGARQKAEEEEARQRRFFRGETEDERRERKRRERKERKKEKRSRDDRKADGRAERVGREEERGRDGSSRMNKKKKHRSRSGGNRVTTDSSKNTESRGPTDSPSPSTPQSNFQNNYQQNNQHLHQANSHANLQTSYSSSNLLDAPKINVISSHGVYHRDTYDDSAGYVLHFDDPQAESIQVKRLFVHEEMASPELKMTIQHTDLLENMEQMTQIEEQIDESPDEGGLNNTQIGVGGNVSAGGTAGAVSSSNAVSGVTVGSGASSTNLAGGVGSAGGATSSNTSANNILSDPHKNNKLNKSAPASPTQPSSPSSPLEVTQEIQNGETQTDENEPQSSDNDHGLQLEDVAFRKSELHVVGGIQTVNPDGTSNNLIRLDDELLNFMPPPAATATDEFAERGNVGDDYSGQNHAGNVVTFDPNTTNGQTNQLTALDGFAGEGAAALPGDTNFADSNFSRSGGLAHATSEPSLVATALLAEEDRLERILERKNSKDSDALMTSSQVLEESENLKAARLRLGGGVGGGSGLVGVASRGELAGGMGRRREGRREGRDGRAGSKERRERSANKLSREEKRDERRRRKEKDAQSRGKNLISESPNISPSVSPTQSPESPTVSPNQSQLPRIQSSASELGLPTAHHTQPQQTPQHTQPQPTLPNLEITELLFDKQTFTDSISPSLSIIEKSLTNDLIFTEFESLCLDLQEIYAEVTESVPSTAGKVSYMFYWWNFIRSY